MICPLDRIPGSPSAVGPRAGVTDGNGESIVTSDLTEGGVRLLDVVA